MHFARRAVHRVLPPAMGAGAGAGACASTGVRTVVTPTLRSSSSFISSSPSSLSSSLLPFLARPFVCPTSSSSPLTASPVPLALGRGFATSAHATPPHAPSSSPVSTAATPAMVADALRCSELCDEVPLLPPGEDLAFAWITPRSLIKGLDGGIMARLLAHPNIRLVGARMYSPSEEFVDEYVAIHKRTFRPVPFGPFIDFCENNLRASVTEKIGVPNHLLFLLFSGKNARADLSKIIGEYMPDPRVGMVGRTIRGAYGDFIRQPNGQITHFQPAIVTASNEEANRAYLSLFARYAESRGGIVDTFYDRLDVHRNYETGMVMIKPDMLEHASSLPGHIMDLFGSTGLHLVGCRVFSFSLKQARAFYGFLEDIFLDKLRGKLEKDLRQALDSAFHDRFAIDDTEYDLMTTILRRKAARAEVDRIIAYMTGVHPAQCRTEEEQRRPGPARCMALLYRGENAIETIRKKLGSTDPSKAAVGTIRSDYGRDIMKNGAHASDSVASMVRERAIIGLVPGRPSSTKRTIEAWLARQPPLPVSSSSSSSSSASSHARYHDLYQHPAGATVGSTASAASAGASKDA